MKEGEIQVQGRFAVLTSLAAGATAGAVAKTVIAPLDRTKINFQVSAERRYSLRAAVCFIRNTYVNEGFMALYRGNSATMARVMPFAAIQYCAHEQWRHVLGVDKQKIPTPVRRFIAGSLAGVTATCCTYPLDLAKARLSTTTASLYPTMWSVFVNVYNTGGVFGFYRGILPTVLGSIPYAGTSFFTFETLKLINRDRTGRTENVFEKLGFGAVAGLCGQSASYPLDILRRRMQTGVIVHGTAMLQVCRTILSNEGVVHGLYKGLSMNWIKGPVAVGVSFAVYETLVWTLREFPCISVRLSS